MIPIAVPGAHTANHRMFPSTTHRAHSSSPAATLRIQGLHPPLRTRGAVRPMRNTAESNMADYQ